MDQRAGDLESRDDRVRFHETRVSGSSSSGAGDVEEVSAEAFEPDDIERTRAHMSETIEEIQQRLTPERVEESAKEVTEDVKEAVIEAMDHAIHEGRTTAEEWSEIARVAALETVDHAINEVKAAVRELGDQARFAVRDATIGKVERMTHTANESTKSFSSNLMTTIRQNPAPAALTGLGIGWLMMSGKSSSSQAQGSSTGDKTVKEMTGDVSGQAKGTVADAKGKAGDVADTAKGKAGEAVDQAQDVAGRVSDQAQLAAMTVTDQAQQAASTVTTQAQQLTTRFRQTLNDNPLAVGLAGLAVGGAAALAVPVTQKEHQVLGGTRDKLVDKVQTGAQGYVEKVQKVAGEAGDAAEKEAKYQGLAPEQ